MTITIPRYHEIKGELVTLRTMQQSDYLQMRTILNDAETMKALQPYFKIDVWTEQMVEERYAKFHAQQEQGVGLDYAVILDETGTVVGDTGFNNISLEHGKAEFGIILHKTMWGTGVAAECHKRVLDYGFKSLGLSTVYFCTDPHNHRMIGFFKKFGMRSIGVNEAGFLCFELQSSEWTEISLLMVKK